MDRAYTGTDTGGRNGSPGCYRRLNSVDILTAFIREAGGAGAVVSDAYMSDTKYGADPAHSDRDTHP